MSYYSILISVLLCAAIVSCGKVEDPSLYPVFDAGKAELAPPKSKPDYQATRSVFWGDLHIHTSLSFDAYTMGVRTLPDDAYTYMKGGTIEHGMGVPIRALRPLDFGAVTDHAEYLGVAKNLDAEAPGKNALRAVMETGSPLRITLNFLTTILTQMGSAETRDASFSKPGMELVSRQAWQQIIDAAERHNEPGVFSSFIAYEWSSMPNEENLHRNVIYKNNNVPDFPYSSIDSDNPEDLWDELDRQRLNGMEVFAIPHNANVSNGRMYERKMFKGGSIDRTYATRRVANEPISEILQIKGASETHPILSATDEFADFGIYDQMLNSRGSFSEPRGSYARDALRAGIEFSHREGFNPFLFGVIGSSDSHNSSSPVEENNYHGKLPLIDGSAGLRLGKTNLLPKSMNRGGRWSAMGLAAVWAEENTRESLFNGMRRRETYATSGPRITLRFFGGWDFDQSILTAENRLELAYRDGVPMGGVLPGAEGENVSLAPTFVIWAGKDPEGANLDRVQIIKGWADEQGVSHEKIYNVAASDGRKVDEATNKLASVGNTVDAATASYQNTIGAVQLATVWQDPDFEPSQQAFYYARVIEIPTPTFLTFDALTLGVAPEEPFSLQERSISSAIWYQSPD